MSLPEASKIISTMWNAMGDDVKTVRYICSVVYVSYDRASVTSKVQKWGWAYRRGFVPVHPELN